MDVFYFHFKIVVPDDCLINSSLPTAIWKLPGECLLISSLPGKASRTLVDIVRLAEI